MGDLISINESEAYEAAKAQQRQIGDARVTIALEQMRPVSRNLRAWLLARTSVEIRPRKWDWLDSATTIKGAMPLGQLAKMFDGVEIVADPT